MKLLHLFSVLAGISVSSAYVVRASNKLPSVDLGYEIHQATFNESGQYYNFSNVRYGAPPIGNLRFMAPTAPSTKKKVFNDGSTAVSCIQALPEWGVYSAAWVENGTAAFNGSTSYNPPQITSLPSPTDPTQTEDCLFLDIMAPKAIFDKAGNGSGAPVMVWIHGGGYTLGSKTLYSPSAAGLIKRSQENGSDGVIWVGINYRLGIFGFLSGPTFQASATANAGLHDQRFALDWVQENIHLFGGDPNRVTLMGESAGGGSVMHQITAYVSLFLSNLLKFQSSGHLRSNKRTILSPPWPAVQELNKIPRYLFLTNFAKQGGLKGKVPFQQAIVQSPGFQVTPSNFHEESIFQEFLSYANVTTVQEAQSMTSKQLQLVNYQIVGESTPYGTFTFNPVVDGEFVPALPGKLLLQGGYDQTLRVMVGHNILEGLEFMDPFARDEAIFEADLRIYEPSISNAALQHISQILYPPIYNGSYPYLDAIARMEVLITEAFFTCNTNWLATAFAGRSWSYIFSVPPSLHGDDIPYTYFNGPIATVKNDTLAETMQRYFTRFAETGDPNGPTVPNFPKYDQNTICLNLNETFIGTVKDNSANERCAWWQKGLYA